MRLLIRGLNTDDISLVKNILIDENIVKNVLNLKDFLNIRSSEIIFITNGINLTDDSLIPLNKQILEIRNLYLGGKGGFGSLLKGQPPTKKRTNNFDSCRDLSGRRIRHVNQEKQLRDWQQKKMEEERLIKLYNEPDDKINVNNYIDNENKKEVMEMNKKYIIETIETTESVTESIKFLMRKKKREVNISNAANNIVILKDKNIKEKKLVSLDIDNMPEYSEKELFSLD